VDLVVQRQIEFLEYIGIDIDRLLRSNGKIYLPSILCGYPDRDKWFFDKYIIREVLVSERKANKERKEAVRVLS